MGHSPVPSTHFRNKFLERALQVDAKTDKVFWFCLSSLDFLIFLRIFCMVAFNNWSFKYYYYFIQHLIRLTYTKVGEKIAN